MSRKTKSPKPSSKSQRFDASAPHVAAIAYRALEPRTVFDAAMIATGVEAAHEQTAAERASLAQFHADTAIEASKVLSAALRDAPAAATETKSVVFIDATVADVTTLLKDIPPSSEIVFLDANKDGVHQIAEYLAAHTGIGAVHILSHGSEGNLYLGSADLNSASMSSTYAADLGVIKAALAPGADILIYGCDFAKGADGDAAAHDLARLTGADVAASTDKTGAATHGGNWVLEDRVGDISTHTIYAPDWGGELAVTITSGGTAAALVQAATNGSTGVTIVAGSEKINGSAAGGVFAGTFTTANSNLGMGSGLVISTGDLAALTGNKGAAYTGGGNGFTANTAGSGVSGAGTKDVVTVSFQFIPNTGKIALSAIFGSEEYYKYVNSGYADNYQVLLTGANPAGAAYNNTNIALLPNSNSIISIDTINKTTNSQYNRDNTTATPVLTDLALNGVTTTLSNTFLVTKGQTYTISFQIADVADNQLDTAAFINFFGGTLTLDLDGNNSTAPGSDYAGNFVGKGGVGVVDSDVKLTNLDPQTNTFKAVVQLTNSQTGDSLSVGTLPATLQADTSVAGQITLTTIAGKTATSADYEAGLKAITFNSTNTTNFSDRVLKITVTDRDNATSIVSSDSNTATSTIHMVADQAPVEVVPVAQATNANAALTINGLSVSDVDAGTSTETVTLSVLHGAISLASKTGLTFSGGTGTSDTSMTFTGTLAQINAAIAGLSYKPVTNYIGADTLTFTTNDNGNTGLGGPLSTMQTLSITVKDVPPTTVGTLPNMVYPDGTGSISIATATGFTNSAGLPMTYSYSGVLPTGLSFNTATGAITGAIDHLDSKGGTTVSSANGLWDGKYTITVTATDIGGGKASQTFTIDATNQAPVTGTLTAAQASSAGASIAGLSVTSTFSDPNLGDVLSYTATDLPPGLNISATGIISGVIAATAPGTYTVKVTATDEKSATATETFTWTINDVPPTANGTLPPQTYKDAQTGVSIATAGGFTFPLTLPAGQVVYSAAGLPAGLTIDAKTGVISGTVDHLASKNAPVTTGSNGLLDGVYTVKVTVSDGQGGTASQTFKIDATNQAPVLGTLTGNQSTNAGAAAPSVDASLAFADPNASAGNADKVTYSASGLPAGLTINAATGVISGTVAKTAAPGVYNIKVTATDEKGAATTEPFTWTVNDVPPVPKGTLPALSFPDSTAGVSIATAGGFTSPNGIALTYSVSGLPAGLTFDSKTGVISGAIDKNASQNATTVAGANGLLDGAYTIVVTASDGQGGTAIQTFDLHATNQAPALGAVTANQSSNAGAAVALDASTAFSDPNAGNVLSYSVSGLPLGLSINTVTGKITGTVDKSASLAGPYSVTVTATDDKGAQTSETFNWAVNNVPPKPNGTLPALVYNDGQAGISIATAGGFTNPLGLPLTYTITGLPAGLTWDTATGKITGTIDHDASKTATATNGVYTVTVTADDKQGGAPTQIFTIDTRNQAPTVGTLTANQTTTTGETVTGLDVSSVFADPNTDPLTFTASGLPAGLTIDPATGKISGTITASVTSSTPFTVVVTAKDDKGAAVTETFTWTVNPTSAISNVVIPDATTGVSIATKAAFNYSWTPTSFSATGLPAGLSIDNSGNITGTLDHDASKYAPSVTGAGATLDGKYTVVVTGTDGLGNTATRSFTIDATNQAPKVLTVTGPQSTDAGTTLIAVDLITGVFSDPNTAPTTADSLTYLATGLPSGLTMDAAGKINGTIAATAVKGSPFSVTVTAKDDKGATTTETFSWTVKDVPPKAINSLTPVAVNDSQTNISIATATAFSNPLSLPLTYSASGLPAGLSINAATGEITGTIDHDASKNAPSTTVPGEYTVTVRVSDGQGGFATQTLLIDSTNQAPGLGIKTTDQTNPAGAGVSVDTSGAFKDPNTGDVLTYTASNLPSGLSINAATGKITGVLGATTPGSYSVNVTATDDKGASYTETFQWTVDNVPPVVVGTIADQLVKDSQAFALATATKFSDPLGLPLTYSATGLPAGLTIDPATGMISGPIDHDASKGPAGPNYTVTVTASDGQGGAIDIVFHITSTNQAPAISAQTPTQSTNDLGKVALNVAKAFTDPNPGDVITYTAAGLPGGLSIDPTTGIISGTIDATASKTGPYTVIVTATDDKLAATTETFTWVVNNVPPTSTAVANQAVNDSQALNLPVANSFNDPLGLPLTFTATGLPKGLSIDPATGVISGTVDHDASNAAPGGVYSVTVTANDGQGGTTKQTFAITSANQAPTVSAQTPDQSSNDGATVALNVASAFTDPNTGDTLTFVASGLPKGLSIDAVTGVISGKIDPSASTSGPYTVVVKATDDKGASTTETFTWGVANVPPVVASQVNDQPVHDAQLFTLNTAANFSDPLGLPLTYSATGLPKGLSIDAYTGKIVGYIDHNASADAPNGVYTVVLTVNDGQGGNVSQSFQITASNDAPTVTSPTQTQVGQNLEPITFDVSSAFADSNAVSGDPLNHDTLTFSVIGLPAGLSIDTATGLISGTIDKSASVDGPFTVSVTAIDNKGATVTEHFTWIVNNVPPTALGPIPDQVVNDGQAFSLNAGQDFASPLGLPLTYTATGLPPGLSIDKDGSVTGTAGKIYGTIDHNASQLVASGVYKVTVLADDGQRGYSLQTFEITSLNQAPVVTALTPSQTSNDGAAVTLNVAAAFTDSNNGDIVTYTATGLPDDLVISSAGVISGTISKSASLHGPFTVVVTATDNKGAATTETFSWTVNDVPPTANGAIAAQPVKDAAGFSLATASAFTNPLGLPLAYTASGLPQGLSIDPATGTITGAVDHNASQAVAGGVYTVTVTVDDGQGGTVSQSFNITASNDAPTVVAAHKTQNQTSLDGNTVNFSVTAAFTDANTATGANHDTLTYTATGLPKGLTLDPTTGVISGAIDKSASVIGGYSVSVTASDGKGGAVTETFTWSVGNVPPVTAAVLTAVSAHDSDALSIPVAAGFSDPLGLPLAFSATGLPAGFQIDPKSGVITGTLDHNASVNVGGGVYHVTVTASDGQSGHVSQNFDLTATNDAPVVSNVTPSQLSTNGASVIVSTSGAFADPNTGDKLTYSANNGSGVSTLPTGLTIDPATGVISGTLDKSASVHGPYTVSITATDNKGLSTTETFTWNVDNLPPQATPSLPAQSVYDSQSFTLDTSTGFQNPLGLPLAYTATGLPAGLHLDADGSVTGTKGTIYGTIDHNASQSLSGGVYKVAVTVDDGQGGKATSTFTITASNQAPTITALTPGQTSKDGDPISLSIKSAFADPNTGDTLTFSATGLPKGLTINATTGLISGTVDKSASVAGTYTVTVLADDGKGGVTPETFSWTIDNVPPTATAIADLAVNDGAAVTISAGSHFTDPIGVPLTFTATGLPKGLTIDPKTGTIAGTIDHDASVLAPGGVYTVTVLASDGQGGTVSETFTITSTNQAPNLVHQTTDQTGSNGGAVSLNVATAFNDPNLGDKVTFTASGLPAGLSIDAKTGVISGTAINPNATNLVVSIMVTATDDKGASKTETFTWTIDNQSLVNAPIPNASVNDSQKVSIPLAASFTSDPASPLVYSATGLPAGLSINSHGLVTGTVDHLASQSKINGAYTVTVTATDNTDPLNPGSVDKSFTITSANQAPDVANVTPNQASVNGATVSFDVSGAFTDPNTDLVLPANSDTLTFTAAGLPPGLSINANGIISGTIAKNAALSGPYSVQITATDDKGLATIETFTWTVGIVPPEVVAAVPKALVNDSQHVTVDVGATVSDPLGLPLTFTATGLPKGLSIDPKTGVITGAIDHDASAGGNGGVYHIVVTASDGQGGTVDQTFTIQSVNQAPDIVASTPDQASKNNGAVSLDASAAFKDPNIGDTLTFATTGLPKGLSIDPKTGLITGTIATNASLSGPYSVSITATDDKGVSTTETFTWTVDNVPPVATIALPSQAVQDGLTIVSLPTAGGFKDPIGLTLTYSASGLPKGLSIDPNTGVISGTLDHDASLLTAGGVYSVVITADDGQLGKAVNAFTMVSTNQAPEVVDPTKPMTSNAGSAQTLDVSAAFKDPNIGADASTNHDSLTFKATGLPPGLGIDPVTGVIVGTIDPLAPTIGNFNPLTPSVGVFTVTVTATDEKGANVSETFTWTVNDVPPVKVGTIATFTAPDSTTGIAIDTAANFKSPIGLTLSYSAADLPSGFTINPTTGKITGSFDHDASINAAPSVTGANGLITGAYTVTVTANDGQGGTITQTLLIEATNQAPTHATSTPNQTSNAGSPVTLDTGKVFSDPNTGDSLTYAADVIPPGLIFDTATGKFSGTLKNTGVGSYTITVTATDDKGATNAETFKWTVKDVPPTAGTTLAGQSFADSTTGISILTAQGFTSPIGLPLTYTATGLPDGLAIDKNTGKITGDLLHNASSLAPSKTPATGLIDGKYTVTVTADDGKGGTFSQTFTIDATNQAPTITTQTLAQATDARSTVWFDLKGAFGDPNAGDTLTFSATGLPTGLSIDAAGKITGTIPQGANGTYTAKVTATDDKGAATTETFTWTVKDVRPVADQTLVGQTFADSTSGISINTAQGFKSPIGLTLTYTATGLPNGLTIDATSGKITGALLHNASDLAPSKTPTTGLIDGTYTVKVIASDGKGGTVSQTFTIDATNQAPTIDAQTGDKSDFARAQLTLDVKPVFGDPNTGDKLTYTVSGLPIGLSTGANGVISGKVAQGDFGTYTVKVTATDDKGAATTETFTWTVKDPRPVAAGPIPALTVPDGTTGISIDAAKFTSPVGLPLTYTATGLPPGLSIDSAGKITGTLPSNASITGPFVVTITADDGKGGMVSQKLTITGKNVPPDLVPDTASVLQGKSITIAPLANDSSVETDIHGLPVKLTVTSATALHGTVTINPDGTLAYKPDPSFFGTETITYQVTDVYGLHATSTVTVTVLEQPARPQVTPSPVPPPLPLPHSVPFVHVDGAVIDTVHAAGGPVGVTGAIGAGGPVLAAVNGISTLNGSGLSDQGPIVAQVLPQNRLSELAAFGQREDSYHPIDLAGLTGFSLHFTLEGATESSAGGGQLIVETLVRERQLLIQVSNTFSAVGLHVSEYRVFQANGRPLPSWLSMAAGGLVLGEAPPSEEAIQLRVIAILDDGSTEERYVTIQTRTGEIQPLAEDQHAELPRLFGEKLGKHTTLAVSEIAELARWLAA